MKNFAYFRPTTVDQAISLLDNRWGNTELLAGGTDLHDLQKEYVAQPTRVVSLNGLANFGGIRSDRANPPRQISIGAGTKLADIAADPLIRQHVPALASAAGIIGGPQIRNMGTLGGNLCQRNRCWYFRDEQVNCLLKGGNRCLAIDGENRYHAIFTQNHRCVIVSPSTLAPVLIAMGASARVQGPNGERTIEMRDFFRAPTGPAEREHVLGANDILLAVAIPIRSQANASYEIRARQSHDWPLVQAAVALEMGENRQVNNTRIVLGHVAPTPVVSEAAAQAVNGREITEETATAAGRAAGQGARPLSQNGYKVKLVEVAVKRALLLAAGGRRYWEI